MDISPEELAHLQRIAGKIAARCILEEVTVTVEEDGQERTVTFTDPAVLQLFTEAALAVHRKHNLEQ